MGGELTFDFFIQGPSKENTESLDPLFYADNAVTVFVKCPEHWGTEKH